METLIDSLLHYSRLGRTDLALDEVDVQEVVDDVVDRLGISLREQNVEVRIPRRLPVIQSDRVRLGEVFANLITNAIKYNDKPQRWIEIGVADTPRAVGGDAAARARRSTCATTASASRSAISTRVPDLQAAARPRPVRRRHRRRAHDRAQDRRAAPRPRLDRIDAG